MLSRTGEYALRAVLLLAAREREGGTLTADVIAAELGVPRNYLSKTLHRLAKRGVLVSERGPRGGFRLAKPAGALPVREVVSEFEEIRPSGRCLMGGLCDPLNPCVAHERWRWWTAEMTQMLDRTTVADFIAENGRRGANRPEVLALPAQHGREDAA